MRLRNRYLLLGVAWALFLAPATAYVVLRVVAGALWIHVFGDNPWPTATYWLIPVIGLVVFAATAMCCIYFAYRYGRQREVAAKDDDPQERRNILLLTLAPLALLVIASVAFWQRGLQQAEATAAIERREAAFNDLLDARHRVAGLTAHRTVSNDFEATITSSGGQAGSYRLLWEVRDRVYRAILAKEANYVELGIEAAEFSIEISIGELASSYRDSILTVGGVLVDEPFELFVTLEPAIEEEDREAWPAFASHQWERGETPLRSTVAIELPVQFRVGQDGTIVYSTP